MLVCLLLVLLSSAVANYGPFLPSQLPRERTINVWKNGFYTFHFGPTGSAAWESFFVTLPENCEFVIVNILDCFCAGDSFFYEATAPGSGSGGIVEPLFADETCFAYSEDPVICEIDANSWGRAVTTLDRGNGVNFNFTLSTKYSPYGGGVGFIAFEFIYTP